MRVIALDPGKATGWAEWHGEGRLPDAGELPDAEVPDWLLLQDLRSDDVLIGERFTITQATVRKSRDADWSIGQLYFARWLCRRVGATFIDQTTADAKRFMPDERLHTLGWWSTSDHARDALRHLGLWLARARLLEVPVL